MKNQTYLATATTRSSASRGVLGGPGTSAFIVALYDFSCRVVVPVNSDTCS